MVNDREMLYFSGTGKLEALFRGIDTLTVTFFVDSSITLGLTVTTASTIPILTKTCFALALMLLASAPGRILCRDASYTALSSVCLSIASLQNSKAAKNVVKIIGITSANSTVVAPNLWYRDLPFCLSCKDFLLNIFVSYPMSIARPVSNAL